MFRSWRWRVVAIWAVAAGVAAAPVAQSDPLADLFARGRALQQTMRTVSASFVETTYSSLVVEPIVARGTVIAAVDPLRVVMRYTTPAARTVWLDDQTLVVAWPGTPRVEALRIAETQRRIQKYFAGASLDELRSSFDLTLATEAGPPRRLRLAMVPKRRQIKEGLQRLQLWLEPDRLVMAAMQMDFPGGDRQMFGFSDVEINPAIPAEAFARPRGGNQ
jgi:outer membrane lipoprotein-sorting protein